LYSTRNFEAAIRFGAASDDGLSDDLCEPTSATGIGNKSGGQREFIEYLARAAVAVGVAAVFMETHPDPDNAPSDGPNMVPLSKMPNLLKQLVEIDKLIKNVKNH